MKIPDEIVREAHRAFGAHENFSEGIRAAGAVFARWAVEEAAKIAESDMLPFSLGGDHILDRATGMTIAEAIRKLAGDEDE